MLGVRQTKVNSPAETRIAFTQEVIDTVKERLSYAERYYEDEYGNVWEKDIVDVVRHALEGGGYQLAPEWYSWGTKAPKLKNYNYEFQHFLDQVADVLHITRTKLLEQTIDATYDLYRKVKNGERLDKHILQDLVLEIAKNIYYSSEAMRDKQVIFTLCDTFLEEMGHPIGSLGIYMCDLQYYQYFKRAHDLVEFLSRGLNPYSLSSKEARLWYMKQETMIRELLDSQLPLKLQAVQAFYLRNCLRIKTRQLMIDQRLAEIFMKNERNFRWYEIVHKYIALGYKGNALWEIIIESSMKSRPTYNKFLGVSEWMVFPGQNWQEYI